MSKLIKGIHHVALKCGSREEYEKVMTFYRDILGMDVLRSWGDEEDCGAMLDTGCGLIEVFDRGQVRKDTGSVNHFALATDDVDACIAAVREVGCTVTVEPKDVTVNAQPPYPLRIAFCIGPVGEEIEFFTEK